MHARMFTSSTPAPVRRRTYPSRSRPRRHPWHRTPQYAPFTGFPRSPPPRKPRRMPLTSNFWTDLAPISQGPGSSPAASRSKARAAVRPGRTTDARAPKPTRRPFTLYRSKRLTVGRGSPPGTFLGLSAVSTGMTVKQPKVHLRRSVHDSHSSRQVTKPPGLFRWNGVRAERASISSGSPLGLFEEQSRRRLNSDPLTADQK